MNVGVRLVEKKDTGKWGEEMNEEVGMREVGMH